MLFIHSNARGGPDNQEHWMKGWEILKPFWPTSIYKYSERMTEVNCFIE